MMGIASSNRIRISQTVFMVLTYVLFQRFAQAQDFWEPTSGPYGGPIDAMCVAGNGITYAAGRGGLYITTNFATNWTLADSGGAIWDVSSIASGGGGYVYVAAQSGLHRSSDNGVTWEEKIDHWSTGVVVHPSGYIFAGISVLLYRSSDEGQTWELKNEGIPSGGDNLFLTVGSAGEIYAQTSEALFVSYDLGESWSESHPEVESSWSAYLMTVSTRGNVFSGMAYDPGVIRSTDHGATWTSVGLDGYYITAMASDQEGNIYAAGEYFFPDGWCLFRSSNEGDTWVRLDPSPRYIRCIYPQSDGSLLAGTIHDGMFISYDYGDTWEESNAGLRNTLPLTLERGKNGRIYAGVASGLFRTDDDGVSWISLGSNLPGVGSISENISGRILIGTDHGVYRSDDDGGSWVQSNSGLSDTVITFLEERGIGEIFCGTWAWRGRVFISQDGGETWRNLDSLTADTPLSIAFDPSGSIYLGTFDGLLKSTDSGLTWRESGFNDIEYGQVKSIAITPEGTIYLWLNTGSYPDPVKGVYRSSDGGSSWVQQLSKPYASEGAVMIASDGKVFAGYYGDSGDNGVSISSDEGETWAVQNSGFTSTYVRSLVQNSDGFVFAGTPHGVFRSHVPVTEVSIGGEVSPLSFHLFQNYPNPFNPTTSISFDVPATGFVELRIFNLLGQEVASVVNGKLDAGTHTVSFDAGNLASGVYLYRLQAGNYIESKKMVVLK
jgi:photosystem II stability/assembly factor-like uncharacterized protein